MRFSCKDVGTSSSDDKLADDLGNAIEGTRIGGRRFSFFTAGNLVPGNRGLLQQNQSIADIVVASRFSGPEAGMTTLKLQRAVSRR
jgi:hypothetical protein